MEKMCCLQPYLNIKKTKPVKLIVFNCKCQIPPRCLVVYSAARSGARRKQFSAFGVRGARRGAKKAAVETRRSRPRIDDTRTLVCLSKCLR